MIGKAYANGKTTAATMDESSTGKPRITVSVKLETGEDARVYLYLSPDAAKYSYEKLARLGYSGKGDPCTQVVGKDCRLSIKTELYQDKEQVKYDFVRNDFVQKEVTGDTKSAMIAALEAAAKDAGSFPPAEASKPPKLMF